MKRLIVFLITFTFIFQLLSPTVYAEADLNHTKFEDDLYEFFQSDYYKNLLDRDKYSYMKFASDFRSDIISQYLIETVDYLINTGVEPDVDEYIKTLVNLITICDQENAEKNFEQNKLDNLKDFRSYAGDIAEIGANAVSVFTGISPSTSKLEQGISTAMGGLDTLRENTDNWIDALTNLETIIQDYSKYDAFLGIIQENADGNLKEAAATTRNSMHNAVQIKLQMYGDVSNENFSNYTEFFFDDLFFEIAKSTDEYTNDSTFQFFVDESENILGSVKLLLSSWDLGLDIGKLIGNLTVGGENLIYRVLEMEALYDISSILQYNIPSTFPDFAANYFGESNEEVDLDEIVTMFHFLVACRQRGEYCLWSILINDAGLLNWINLKNNEEVNEWYNSQADILSDIKNNIPVNNASVSSESDETKQTENSNPARENLIQKLKDLGLSGKLASYESKYKNYTLYYPAEWIERLSFTETETGLAINTKDGLMIAEEENYGSGFWRHTCYLLAKVFYDYADAAECYAATEDPNSLIHTEDLFWKKGAGVESFQNLPVSDDMNYVLYLEKNDSMPDGWHEVSSNTESTLERAEATREVIRKIEVLKYGFIENQNIAGE